MASLLYRLGHFAVRRRRLVLMIWLLLFGAMGLGAATLSGPTNGSFSIPGAESHKAIQLLSERFPDANGASGRVVFAAPQGQSLRGERAQAVRTAVHRASALPGVLEVTDPFPDNAVSPDGRIALSQISFDTSSDELTDTTREAVRDAIAPVERAGVEVEYGGDAVIPPAESALGEIIGLPIAALVLLLTFGSLVAAGLPLLTAVVGVGIGLTGIITMTGFIDLDSSVPTVALMLGLAVGIDYAVFIVSRHRSQLRAGLTPEESAARAVGTAGSAVVFAGATVVIALAGLSVVRVPFLTAMGLAAAATIAVAVLVAITLVPALLGFAGSRMARGKNFDTGPRAATPTQGSRWVAFVTRHRIPVVAVTTLILIACAAPVLSMRLGMPDDSSAAPQETNRQAYDLVSTGFGPGSNGPLQVVVSAPGAGRVQAAASGVAERLQGLDHVASVSTPVLNDQGDTAVISVVPTSGPSTPTTKSLVNDVREQAPAWEQRLDADVLVTGQTAVNIDVADTLGRALIPFLAIIVGLALILLTIAFRSVLVPLTAVGGFLLTIGAAFGGLVTIFQKGVGADLFGVAQPSAVISLLPIIAIGILFGLAMDYQVFLVSRMREERAHGASAIAAVTEGFRYGARVVTAAALIMVSVFSGFILEHDAIIKSVGFTLAFGILVDAFVVRMTLIPAVMALLGDRMWWLPRWLDRLLPHVDIEGQALGSPDPAMPPREDAPQFADASAPASANSGTPSSNDGASS